MALTDAQQAAVFHADGKPARVLAGAGTGKTRVIVARFLHLVERGIRPERMLALTFSRSAAAQMRAEILSGLAGSARLYISTFHSFCLKLLEESAGRPLRLVPEAEARAILAALGARDPDTAHAFIGQAKDQLLTPDQVQRYADANPDPNLADHADLYRRLQAELTARTGAEYADFIGDAVALLERDPAVAQRWQGRFDHILVDEFQDANPAQFRVLAILARPHSNLMVVGDDDQAIYRFRGATDRYMRRFPEFMPEAVDYPVTENFRCPAPVLAAANALIARNAPDRVEKRLYTTTKQHGYPEIAHWVAETEPAEASAVAAEIDRRLRTGGQRPGDFAILLRSVRRSGAEFARALTERSIPCQVVGEERPHPIILQTRALLRLVHAPTAADRLAVLAGRLPPPELLAAIRTGADLTSLPAYGPVAAWLAAHATDTPAELAYEALHFLGHLRIPAVLTAADLDRLAAARALCAEAAAGLLNPAGPGPRPEAAPAGLAGPGSGAIMTIHAAKGLQFPTVFLAGLAEGRFPVAVDAPPAYYLAEAIADWAATGQPAATGATERLAQHIREERRLAYVAITRAERELILTRAATYGGEVAQPSRFLAELGAPPARKVAPTSAGSESAGFNPTEPLNPTGARTYLLDSAASARPPDPARLAAARAALAADPTATPLRRQADPAPFVPGDSLRLSHSALDTYLTCPRQYYYAYVLNLPGPDNVYTAFGSALHAALEGFNKAYMAGPLPSWPDLHARWTAAMRPADFESETQYLQLHERGRFFLQRFHEWAVANPYQVISVEGGFELPYRDAKGRRHTIRGRYDLVIRDPAGGEAIIDYKSGHRVSTGVNKRPTGRSDNDPQRKLQLGIYYLARHGDGPVPGAKVTYIFLRHPDDRPPLTFIPAFDQKGDQVIACEHTAESLAAIRTRIDAVIDQILANDFHREPDDRKCSQCPYRDPCEVSRREYY